MRKNVFVLGALLFLVANSARAIACVPSHIASLQYKVTGIATNPKGEHIYTEKLIHSPGPTGGRMDSLYTLPNGTEIAVKSVDYHCAPTTPSFSLRDLQSGEAEGVEWIDNKIRSFQGNEQKILSVPEGNKIFDAGFDNFVRLNWQALMNGETLKVNYLFARDNQFLKLRLQRSEKPPSLSEPIDNIVFFKISANNLLFRLLSSTLYLGYDINNQALAYYSGPSNLQMMKHHEDILIRYSYTTPPKRFVATVFE